MWRGCSAIVGEPGHPGSVAPGSLVDKATMVAFPLLPRASPALRSTSCPDRPCWSPSPARYQRSPEHHRDVLAGTLPLRQPGRTGACAGLGEPLGQWAPGPGRDRVSFATPRSRRLHGHSQRPGLVPGSPLQSGALLELSLCCVHATAHRASWQAGPCGGDLRCPVLELGPCRRGRLQGSNQRSPAEAGVQQYSHGRSDHLPAAARLGPLRGVYGSIPSLCLPRDTFGKQSNADWAGARPALTINMSDRIVKDSLGLSDCDRVLSKVAKRQVARFAVRAVRGGMLRGSGQYTLRVVRGLQIATLTRIVRVAHTRRT